MSRFASPTSFLYAVWIVVSLGLVTILLNDVTFPQSVTWFTIAGMSLSVVALINHNTSIRCACVVAIIMIINIAVINSLHGFPIPITAYFLTIMITSAYLTYQYDIPFSATMVILLSSFLMLLKPIAPIETLVASGCILVALLLIIVGQWFFLINTLKKQWLNKEKTLFLQLEKLTASIFNCLIDRNYQDNIYLFEHRIHLNNMACIMTLNDLQTLLQRHAAITYKVAYQDFALLNRFHTCLLSLGQLRWRIKDKSIFEVCTTEFLQLKKTLMHLLHAAATKNLAARAQASNQSLSDALVELNNELEAMEAIYQRILQVIAPDPAVFLLFLNSINQLTQAVAEWIEDHSHDAK